MLLLTLIRFIVSHPLNRHRRFRSVVAFVMWQLGSRLIPGEVMHPWVGGSRFFVRTGETGLTGNVYTGLHEFADMGFLLHFLRPNDLFVDVGANVGSYTILACSVAGASGVAFEPIPATYRRLVENMRLNHLETRVRCLNAGVGASHGNMEFTSDCDTTNHALAPGESSDKKISVEVMSLDSVLADEQPALMKIDVEGFETLVLQGAQETLAKSSLNAVIMELNGSGARYGFDETKLIELMLANGFSMYSYDPFERKLLTLDGKNARSGNTLFIRNPDLVENRLRTARKVAVHGREF